MEENSLKHTCESKWQVKVSAGSVSIGGLSKNKCSHRWTWKIKKLAASNEEGSHVQETYLWGKVSHNSCNKLITVYTSCKSGQKLLSLVGWPRYKRRTNFLLGAKQVTSTILLMYLFSLLIIIYYSLACKPRKVEK